MLIKAQNHVTPRLTGRGKLELFWYPGEGACFFRPDVDEIGRPTAGGAVATGHVNAPVFRLGTAYTTKPRRKRASRQILVVSGPDIEFGIVTHCVVYFDLTGCSRVEIALVCHPAILQTRYEYSMFEYDQEIVDSLLSDNENFQSLYQQHHELKEQVMNATSGIHPLDDLTLGKMKKQKLLAKDKMAILIERYRQAHA